MGDSLLNAKSAINKYLEKKMWGHAIQDCLKAKSLYPNDNELKILLAEAYLGENNLMSSEKEIIQAIEVDDNSSKALNLYAVVLLRMNKLDQAISVLQKAIRNDSNYWKSRFNLAEVYLTQGKYKEALSEYKNAFKINKSILVFERLYPIWLHENFYVNWIIVMLIVFVPFNNELKIAIPFAILWLLYTVFITKVNFNNKNIAHGAFTFTFGTIVSILHFYYIIN